MVSVLLKRREEEERLRREEEERERAKKEAEEAEAKAKADAAKKEKEAQKKNLKQRRKALRNLCKERDFFSEGEEEKIRHMGELDKLCEVLDAEQLGALHDELQKEGRAAMVRSIDEMNKKLDKEKFDMMEKSAKGAGATGDKSGSSGPAWSGDELALLIKAVNLFPAGTHHRHNLGFFFLKISHAHSSFPQGPVIGGRWWQVLSISTQRRPISREMRRSPWARLRRCKTTRVP